MMVISDLTIEFLLANLRKNDYRNRESLKIAFDYFDTNHDGSIPLLEFKRVFGGMKEETIINTVISKFGNENDNVILHYYTLDYL